jgi:hypothetical protein
VSRYTRREREREQEEREHTPPLHLRGQIAGMWPCHPPRVLASPAEHPLPHASEWPESAYKVELWFCDRGHIVSAYMGHKTWTR